MATSKISKSASDFRIETYTYTYNISGNGSLTITNANLGIVPIDGYTPVGFVQLTTGVDGVLIRSFNASVTGTGNCLFIKNTTSQTQNNVPCTIRILWMRD